MASGIGGGNDIPVFCEHCGASTGRPGPGAQAPIPVCGQCDRASCTNCWNQVTGRCLVCSPSGLAWQLTAPLPPQAAPIPVQTVAAPSRGRRFRQIPGPKRLLGIVGRSNRILDRRYAIRLARFGLVAAAFVALIGVAPALIAGVADGASREAGMPATGQTPWNGLAPSGPASEALDDCLARAGAGRRRIR